MAVGTPPFTMGRIMSVDVVIVGGCGHVGLPFGIMLARAGLQVGLLDPDEAKKNLIRRGEMPFLEYGAEEPLADTIGRTLHVLAGPADVAGAEYVVIAIGTPIDEHLNPRFGPLFAVLTQLAPLLGDTRHVVLRSTVFPGTTKELSRHLATLDLDVHLTYCPERIAQGYAMTELDRLPQIISGFSDEAIAGALRLFGRLTDRTIVVDVEEAELAKLFLNSWRYIQFAIANQFYMIAEERGLDYFRIHDAMVHGYERAADYPLPGFTAGPCLLKDTMQLSAFEQNRFPLGHAAMLVNEGLPGFLVSRLRDRFDLERTTVGILGMAFKADIDDTRDSLAYKLRKLLVFHGARVLASDAFAEDPSFVSVEQLLTESDVIVIGAPHAVYRELEWPPGKPVVDVWGFLRRERVEIGAP
jgi:UDP-N-acetyl-D-mannosaminuronic acid dehydrogenase